MNKPTLVVMAAGMGNRYGGLKQIDPIGPSGETIIDYSAFDALRAGFGRLVFVIRREIEQPFKEGIGSRLARHIPVAYVFQELSDVPPGFAVPPARKKPWGTGHAILAAAGEISEPFGAINADDFYGEHSFRVLASHLNSGPSDYAMVGFLVRNTLSEFGGVTRALCRVRGDGFLESVTELPRIAKSGDGATFTDTNGVPRALSGDETVSMSMWGFTPTIFDQLSERWLAFLRQPHLDENAELLLPTQVNAIVATGEARCRVLHTTSSWFGVTYQDDRPLVVDGIRQLVAQGDYPAKLWK